MYLYGMQRDGHRSTSRISLCKSRVAFAPGIGRTLVETVMQYCRSIRGKRDRASDTPRGGPKLFLETIICPHTSAAIAL